MAVSTVTAASATISVTVSAALATTLATMDAASTMTLSAVGAASATTSADCGGRGASRSAPDETSAAIAAATAALPPPHTSFSGRGARETAPPSPGRRRLPPARSPDAAALPCSLSPARIRRRCPPPLGRGPPPGRPERGEAVGRAACDAFGFRGGAHLVKPFVPLLRAMMGRSAMPTGRANADRQPWPQKQKQNGLGTLKQLEK